MTALEREEDELSAFDIKEEILQEGARDEEYEEKSQVFLKDGIITNSAEQPDINETE